MSGIAKLTTLLGNSVKTIELYSTNSTLRSWVRENLARPGRVEVIEHCKAGPKSRANVNEVQHEGVFVPLPDSADIVLTKSALNSKTEWLAARLNALPAVIPEADSWLRDKVAKMDKLVIVGAEQAR